PAARLARGGTDPRRTGAGRRVRRGPAATGTGSQSRLQPAHVPPGKRLLRPVRARWGDDRVRSLLGWESQGAVHGQGGESRVEILGLAARGNPFHLALR